MSFDELNIDPRCLKVLKQQGITTPTPIQAQAIPVALESQDVIAIAQTGTGKTLAFGLPALTQLAGSNMRNTRMIVLALTRELAQQVHDVLEPHARVLGLRSACVYGGVGMDRQAQALRTGAAIIVATPGRLIDHMERGNTNFKHVSVLVLDEADRMLDMGFMPSIERILGALPKERQTMMFSATFPNEIAELTRTFQRDAVRIQVGAIACPAKDVKQGVYTVQSDKKLSLLSSLLRDEEVTSALIFMRTKHRTDRIAKALHAEGFKAQAIHGGRTQRQRQQAIDGFRQGRYNVLVATDVAARGLDVQGISHVVNFDIPNSTDDYVHRIGRTGRANASGIALTLVCPEEGQQLRCIERELGNNIPRAEWEGAVHIGGGSSERDERRGGGQRSNYGRSNGGYRGRSNNDRDRGDRYERPARAEHSPRAERPERADRGGERAYRAERPVTSERTHRSEDRFERAANGFESQQERSWSPRRPNADGQERRHDGERGQRREGGQRSENVHRQERGHHAGERGNAHGAPQSRQQRAEHGHHRGEAGQGREQRRGAGAGAGAAARGRSRGPARGR